MKIVRNLMLTALLGTTGLLTSNAAMALDGADLYKKKTCIACHGADANSPILPSYPRLAGQSAGYAMQQMKDIKDGTRSNGQTAAMKPIMHLVSDEEMQAIADWLATLGK
ncbi:MAG: cytochrome c [Candidatus Cloacimonetes bacterium]|jgi:cytochrome c|nr:cytochrome c [Candidatus Cloacimonadota bacterium]